MSDLKNENKTKKIPQKMKKINKIRCFTQLKRSKKIIT